MRATYEKFHHPRIFAANLKNILAGESGFHDPQEMQRERNAVNRVLVCLQGHAGNNNASGSEFSIGQLQEIIDQAIESQASFCA